MEYHEHLEAAGLANARRQKQYEQLERYIGQARGRAEGKRKMFFRPDFSSPSTYALSLQPYRESFADMLGWPLKGYDRTLGIPTADIEYVASDPLSRIYRLEVHLDEALSLYGLFFVPHTVEGPCPLVLVQHGGSGTPELCAGFNGPSNYNGIIQRILRRGCAVFAPQLHLWTQEQGPENNRNRMDNQLKQLGSSITAVEIFKLRRALDYLETRPEIRADRIGMAGLSYGGFYTLFMAAADTRIQAALSSCFLNDRFVYDRVDWTWRNSGNTFLDAEVAGLICPRPFYIEVGLEDELFLTASARPEAAKVKTHYERLGIADRFHYREFQGRHEFDPSDHGVEFLCRFLCE
ncbi:alpha/beta hydrolase family protein [Paenibacillus koleovorans]|uniref:alpha/beta hydrolase family protein n=1 Tax=Paenibacillus koleovorans TaxID=121608 RepID=UPI000FDC9160|nr:dienelactone hydrolase family protein [Paenibacillus koleovorans]